LDRTWFVSVLPMVATNCLFPIFCSTEVLWHSFLVHDVFNFKTDKTCRNQILTSLVQTGCFYYKINYCGKKCSKNNFSLTNDISEWHTLPQEQHIAVDHKRGKKGHSNKVSWTRISRNKTVCSRRLPQKVKDTERTTLCSALFYTQAHSPEGSRHSFKSPHPATEVADSDIAWRTKPTEWVSTPRYRQSRAYKSRL